MDITKKWILEIFAILCVMLGCFKASAEQVWYQVKYLNEYGNTQTTSYKVNTEKSVNTTDNVKLIEDVYSNLIKFSGIIDEIIDEDSDAKDLAIVNKLERQGYISASPNNNNKPLYLKVHGNWHKL